MKDGSPDILGATFTGDGVNFAVRSRAATRVDVCLYDSTGQRETARLTLPGRTGAVHHGFVERELARVGSLYGIRVHGVYDPREGYRFNANKLLIDPCARDIVGDVKWHPSILGYDATDAEGTRPSLVDSAASMPRCRVIDPAFDWKTTNNPPSPGATPSSTSCTSKVSRSCIRTCRRSGVANISRSRVPAVLDHLKALGVTAVELMPVHAFTGRGIPARARPHQLLGLQHRLAWFAPTSRYAVKDPVVELKQAVKALHAAGIEVILDVVYNHTAEGNELGPTLNFRGIDNRAYYFHRANDRRFYDDVTGVGNTVACDHPIVQADIVRSLRYFAEEFRIDGFRFDLATVLGRDRSGFNSNSPFFVDAGAPIRCWPT